MSGLKLGDLILDPRRVLYIPSLNAVVCAGLHEALGVGISGGLRGVLERIDSVLEEYKPDSLIVLGGLAPGIRQESALAGMARRWGSSGSASISKRTRLQLVVKNPEIDIRGMAETLGCEVHHELVWGRYRFVESDADGGLDVQLLTIAGSPHYAIRVGSSPFKGMKLAVFLKGIGRLTLPSINPALSGTTIFSKTLERCDVFAVGHQRVLPMGKVVDLRPFKGIARGLPIAKATLGAKRKAPKEPLVD